MQSIPYALNLKKSKGRLECRLNNPKSMMIPTSKKSFKIERNVEKDIFRSYKKILDMAKKEKTDPNFEKELRIMGDELWSNILEPIFSQFDLVPVVEGSHIALELEETTVDFPWELALCKRRPFRHLCELVNIGRKRDVVCEGGFLNALRTSKGERAHASAIVVGLDYDGQNRKLELAVKEAEEIATFLESKDVSVTRLVGPKATKTSVMKELKRGANIFHFTGHGSKGKDQSEIFLANREILKAEDFMKELGNNLAPTFSFINACETTTERHTIGASRERYSWAFAMAGIGGRACIGTLWTIDENGALEFARNFYKSFFGKNRARALGDSVRQARLLLKNKAKENTVWPAYVLYGPPALLVDDILI